MEGAPPSFLTGTRDSTPGRIPCDHFISGDKQHLGPAIPTWAPSTAGPQPRPPPSSGTSLVGVEGGGPRREVTKVQVTQQWGGDEHAVVGGGAYLKWREM